MELITNRSLVYNYKPINYEVINNFDTNSPPQYGKLPYFQIAIFRWFEGVISVLHHNKAKQLFLRAIM